MLSRPLFSFLWSITVVLWFYMLQTTIQWFVQSNSMASGDLFFIAFVSSCTWRRSCRREWDGISNGWLRTDRRTLRRFQSEIEHTRTATLSDLSSNGFWVNGDTTSLTCQWFQLRYFDRNFSPLRIHSNLSIAALDWVTHGVEWPQKRQAVYTQFCRNLNNAERFSSQVTSPHVNNSRALVSASRSPVGPVLKRFHRDIGEGVVPSYAWSLSLQETKWHWLCFENRRYHSFYDQLRGMGQYLQFRSGMKIQEESDSAMWRRYYKWYNGNLDVDSSLIHLTIFAPLG